MKKIAGILIIVLGMVFVGCTIPTTSTPTPTPTYSDLPAAAAGNWSVGGTVVFSVSGSQMTMNGTTIPVQYYTADGQLYMVPADPKTKLTGIIWNGTAFTYAGVTMTKS